MTEGRQDYNVTLGILTLAGIAFALQQTMGSRRCPRSSTTCTRRRRG
jgi:hypothetical protein